ncbi:hypothetical protein N7456_004601 [Penicillium angulare]|uniref:Uncharacterized protein n=1 Tax=Penicillium angulare TaxID=116970 RepID=A0A9W9KJC3_9EURO|nr:hypothetical protein N7456_004601 [Penicillium angulare]
MDISIISAGTPSNESKVPFNSTLGQNRDYDGSEEEETTSDDDQEHVIDDYGSLDDDDDPFIDGEIIHANLMYKQRTMFKYKEVVNGAGVTGQQSAVRDRMILQQDLRLRISKVLGLGCIGPSRVIQMMTSEFCPNNILFTEDNVVMAKAPGQIECRKSGCEDPTWEGTALCETHFMGWIPSIEDLGPDAMLTLKTQFRAATQQLWRARPKAQGVIDRIMAGARFGNSFPSVVCIDLEASIRTGRVFQIGICDIRGERVLDCLTYLSEKEIAFTSMKQDQNRWNIEAIVERKARLRPSSQGKMSAAEVANKLRAIFPYPKKTIFISWAKWKFDLSHLRKWLEREGHYRVLPGDENCYLLMTDYRQNLDRILGKHTFEGGVFPLSLPNFFPTVVGKDHELTGRNHHALVDAKQLAFLVRRFVALCGAATARPALESLQLRPKLRRS